MTDTTLRTETVPGGTLELVRSAFGQVVEYDVYFRSSYNALSGSEMPDGEGTLEYVGGGTRRQAERLFKYTAQTRKLVVT